jgi:superfamily II DNA or RNA helicase
LIVVPTVSLVAQLHSDFNIYGEEGWDAYRNVHCIMEGKSKDTEKPITISTWQSIYKMPKNYFDQFDVVIGDECHLFKAKSLTSIMTKLTKAKHRIGTTGTLDGTDTHQLILEGLFGPVKQITTTKELIDSKQLSDFHIKALTLRYSEDERKRMARSRYQDEIDFIVAHEKRRNFIRNLTVSLDGNTLVLFQYVEKHGKPLYECIKNAIDKDRKIFFVYGGTDVDQRERVRAIVEEENNAIIVASNGVYSTGVNIKRLHNIIFTHPGKSKVRTLQSIGRGLRTGEDKTIATLYDIVDDLGYKTHKNFAIKHFLERHKHYMDEKFDVKIYKVDLK